MAELLKGLNSINWANYQHAYGSASDTPDCLRALASPNPAERERALDRLWFTIYHQGSIYEAAIPTVPFLVELLQEPRVFEKEKILTLLFLLSVGGSWHDQHRHFSIVQKRWNEEKLDEICTKELDWVKRLRREISGFLDVYFELLGHESVPVRLHASYLLSAIESEKEKIWHRLIQRFPCESSDLVQANILVVLNKFTWEGKAEFYLKAASSTLDVPLVRIVAVSRYAESSGSKTPEFMLDEMQNVLLMNDRKFWEEYDKIPSAGGVLFDLSIPLVQADPRRAPLIIPQYAEMLCKRPFAPEHALSGLLFIALCADGKRLELDNLSDIQKHAVFAAAHQAWPYPMTEFPNAIEIMKAYGLPTCPEEIDRLLDLPSETHGGFTRSNTPKPNPWWKFW